MALTMAEIRARLQAQENKGKEGGGGFSNEPQAFLAHWNIPEGIPLNLRFLPDGGNNDFFWKEVDRINLWFAGVKGGDQKPVKVVVPCNEMWGPINSCPVLKEVREWYKSKDPQLEALAQKYWKKKSYLFQVFVAPDSCEIEGDVMPENPIRRVMFNKPLFNKVKSILMNPKIPHLPTDVEHGRDFAIIKGKNGGGFAEYDQSQWDMYERPLNDLERAAIDKYGLFDLSEFMPKQPTEAELQAIAEMFDASVNGEQYDPARWAQFYRPAGVSAPAGGSAAQAAPAAAPAQPVVQPAAAPVATPVQEAAAPAAAPVTGNAMAALAALQRSTTAAPQTLTESAPAPTATAKSTSTSALLSQLLNK